ncbi:MAG: PCRF domain-containing protein, partial [Proteobacteria bacterium]|nr:PCRF domain-containing protein [Desulfobacula sp.]MBU4129897.1 PCRF domain-containing protein [Pseudomonadota bacterium]
MPGQTNSRSIFDLSVKEKRFRELEHFIARQDFWDDADKATDLLKERTTLSGLLETCQSISDDIEEADLLLEMALEESDKESEQEVANLLTALERKIKK